MKRSIIQSLTAASLIGSLSLACSGATPSSSSGGTSSGSTLTTGSSSNGSGSTSTASGGTAAGAGGTVGTGSTAASGGVSSTGGAAGTGGSTDACNSASLTWKTANKTNYTSYPDPGSEECVKYNGCMWAGQFAACSGVKTEEWVAAHNIAALFPLGDYSLHDICIKSGDKVMIVTVYDTCADSDCSGCCTANKGGKDALIDLESYTNARWGLADGAIEWADLGPSATGCD